MSTQEQKVSDQQEARQPQQNLHAMIGEQVIHLLGQPNALMRVQVRKLWEDRYRVNVFTTSDDGSAVVAHSYFLVTDGKGKIISANPTITKQH